MSEPFQFYSPKLRPTTGSHFPAPTANMPLDDLPTNPPSFSSISPSLDAAKDYTDITQHPMHPNVPPAAVTGMVTSLSTVASMLGVEEAPLPVPTSMGPATKK